jgi:hypothetical protein
MGLKSPFGTPLAGATDHFFKITSGEGRTGDVIHVDLKQSLGGTAFLLPTFNSLTVQVDAEGDFHLFQGTEEIGELLFSDHFEATQVGVPGPAFLNTGRMLFIPESAKPIADSQPQARGFQGTIQGQLMVDGVSRTFEIVVGENFSTEGPNAVTSNQALRIQQRLKFLGFPGTDGKVVQPTGMTDANTQYAIRLFNAAVRGTTPTAPTDPADL